MKIYVFLALVYAACEVAVGHITLTWPPARKYALDYLDNVRTDPPCGVPKGLGPVTNFEAGSSIVITWHMAFPHQGGYLIEILDEYENVSLPVTGGLFIGDVDTTTLSDMVNLPAGYTCHGCTLRIVRQAIGRGINYKFWSCADINILSAPVADPGACNGHLQFDTPEDGRDYSVDWEYDHAAQNIKFILTGRFQGADYWMGVGLSNDTSMPESDIIIGWINPDGSGTLSDRWATVKSLPPADAEQDVTLELAGLASGDSILIFSRNLTTADEANDFQISETNCPYIMYAIGPRTSGVIEYHGSAKRITTERVCFKPCQTGPTYSKDCSGAGSILPGTSVCECDRLRHGNRCQYTDMCEDASDCSNHGECIDRLSTFYPKRLCFCDPGYHGMKCEKISPISSTDIDYNLYNDITLSATAVLYYRILEASDELEVVMRAKTQNWMGVGFKPTSSRKTCQDFPFKQTPSGTGEPEGEGSTSEPEGSTAEPEGSTAEPEGSTAEPEGSTAEPEGSTSEPEPEGTAEPEGGTGDSQLHPMDCADITIGMVRGNRSCIGDFYTRDRSTPQWDEFYGGTQSLTAALGFEDGDYTVMVFRRPLKASEPTDNTIGDWSTAIIWAVGQEMGNYRHDPPGGLSVGTPSIPDYYRLDEVKYHGSGNTQRGYTDFNLLAAPAVSCQAQVWEDGKLYKVEWEYIADQNEIEFTMTARLNGENWWLAVGLSENRQMLGTDVALAYVDAGGNVKLTDRFNPSYYGTVEDAPTSQDLRLIKGEVVDGETRIVYRRPMTTSDSGESDFQITATNCPYIIYGIGPMGTGETIRKHITPPRVTQQKICFIECQDAVPEPTPDQPTPEVWTTPSGSGHVTALTVQYVIFVMMAYLLFTVTL